MCVAFIAGIAFVYSCGGGGGSSSGAAATIGELEARVVALEAKLANVVINNNPLVGLSGPHFIFSGVNVHVRNGSGQSDTTNGVGNIIVGYNEPDNADTSKRTGSHNLVIGQEHEYSRYNGLVAGFNNRLEGVHSTVSGGYQNVASAFYAVVSGGRYNDATGDYSSVNGGLYNVAGGIYSSVSGGYGNSAGGNYASISGGAVNSADGNYASVSGGAANSAGGGYASVSGGRTNSAGGDYASVSGGNVNSAPATYQSDETPDYDSGWQAFDLAEGISFSHNLGGDVDNYTVVLDQEDTVGTKGIHNHYIGDEVYMLGGVAQHIGSFWDNLTTTSVRVWRLNQASNAGKLRIRIWKHKS